MRLRCGLITLFVVTACSTPKEKESQFAISDSTNTVESVLSESIHEDSLNYIGYIQKFEDNNSFYTDLNFVENFNYDLYDEVSKMADSVVFQDEETKRARIPTKIARQYFNLTGLNKIDIYSQENQKLTTGQLSHIEYVEDMIESRFVAVFDVDNPHVSGYSFCIGNAKHELETMTFTPFEHEKLEQELIDYLKLNTDHIWSVDHYKSEDQNTYSTVSADTTAYIVETANYQHTTLYKSKFSEAINGLIMVSHKINDRPILITDCGMPETDMTWTSVLIFNGTEYEPSRDHRTTGL